MRLYKLTTTFSGADGASNFYYNTKAKAMKALEDLDNGEVTEVELTADYNLNYSDGCTANDLTYGNFDADEVEVDSLGGGR